MSFELRVVGCESAGAAGCVPTLGILAAVAESGRPVAAVSRAVFFMKSLLFIVVLSFYL